ncbi:MAG TPA: hypothetical protein VGO61_20200 [Steroidobacteraceae bacterium]|jgi:hypothetical protein|nr:hypothetical protein [Steroidobacteraceae bacterium]
MTRLPQYLALAALLLVISVIVVQRVRRLSDSKARAGFKAKLEATADDLSTSPDGLSLGDVVDLLPRSYIEEILSELEKMPHGSRMLQRAIEATGAADYELRPNTSLERTRDG